MPEHPREDLTERLRKEFGLNIDESDGEDVDSSGLPDALNARLQGGYDYKLDRDDKRNIGDTRHRNNSGSKSRDTWDSHKTSREAGMHRGTRDVHRDSYELGMSRERGEEMSKSGRDRDIQYERKKIEKSGRSMSSQPNQGGDRRSRPRTPLGSPTRRSSVGESSSYHGKDRGTAEQARRNNSYSKNYHAS